MAIYKKFDRDLHTKNLKKYPHSWEMKHALL